MFSIREKREISDKIQNILRETNHPELPKDEIQFVIHVKGLTRNMWANIMNNSDVVFPSQNYHNEKIDNEQ